MAWSALTHKFLGEWKEQKLEGKRLLVLWSGGADSTALLWLARELQKPLGFELTAGHFHHGPHPKFSEFRDRALRFCEEKAAEWGVPLLKSTAAQALSSEEEMREFRLHQSLEWKNQYLFDRILVAHHADDLLETRFFRLLRGTGLQGLASMAEWAPPFWRPFLPIPRTEIRKFLEWNQLAFKEDPSNFESDYRRNWIRQEIFPQLEKGLPGALKNLSESLQRMVDSFEESEGFENSEDWTTRGIPRPWFLTLTASQQKRALAQYLWSLGVRDFRQTQLEEVLKHLDNPELIHKLSTAGCDWSLNAERILALPRKA
jgi:tRNA(Ile)-lysidine synthase